MLDAGRRDGHVPELPGHLVLVVLVGLVVDDGLGPRARQRRLPVGRVRELEHAQKSLAGQIGLVALEHGADLGPGDAVAVALLELPGAAAPGCVRLEALDQVAVLHLLCEGRFIFFFVMIFVMGMLSLLLARFLRFLVGSND